MRYLILSTLLLAVSFCNAQNVGIGVDTPKAKLHIYNKANQPSLILQDSSASFGGSIQLRNTPNPNKWVISSELNPTITNTNRILFGYNNTPAILTVQANKRVGINNTLPSASLDIQSTTDGILIPRMTSAQRNAIATPSEGMLLYVTTDSSFYYYKNGWNQLGDFFLPQEELFTETDNAIVGANANRSAFQINYTNTAPSTNNNVSEQSAMYVNAYSQDVPIYANKTMATGKATAILAMTGVPSDSNNAFEAYAFSNGHAVIARKPATSTIGNGIEVDVQNTNGIGLNCFAKNNIAGKFDSEFGNALITDRGNVGIGVNNPGFILDVKNRMRIRYGGDEFSTAGIFFDGAGSPNIGFMGMYQNSFTGSEALGMYDNGNWSFLINTNTHNVGIGSYLANPTEKLEVQGNIKSYGNVLATNDVQASGSLKTTNKVNRTVTGNSDMVAYAYGTINSTGTDILNSSNFNITKIGVGTYQIELVGQNYNNFDFLATATVISNGLSSAGIATVNQSGNYLLVSTYSGFTGSTPILADRSFSFVVYKK